MRPSRAGRPSMLAAAASGLSRRPSRPASFSQVGESHLRDQGVFCVMRGHRPHRSRPPAGRCRWGHSISCAASAYRVKFRKSSENAAEMKRHRCVMLHSRRGRGDRRAKPRAPGVVPPNGLSGERGRRGVASSGLPVAVGPEPITSPTAGVPSQATRSFRGSCRVEPGHVGGGRGQGEGDPDMGEEARPGRMRMGQPNGGRTSDRPSGTPALRCRQATVSGPCASRHARWTVTMCSSRRAAATAWVRPDAPPNRPRQAPPARPSSRCPSWQTGHASDRSARPNHSAPPTA